MAKQAALVAALCAALTFYASAAAAQTAEQHGYICSAAYVPTDGSGMSPTLNKGRLGYVTFDVYSGPECTGRMLSTGYFCSSGATSSKDCYPFSQIGNAAALAQKEATLLAQGARGHQVTVYRRDPNGPVIFVRSYAH